MKIAMRTIAVVGIIMIATFGTIAAWADDIRSARVDGVHVGYNDGQFTCTASVLQDNVAMTPLNIEIPTDAHLNIHRRFMCRMLAAAAGNQYLDIDAGYNQNNELDGLDVQRADLPSAMPFIDPCGGEQTYRLRGIVQSLGSAYDPFPGGIPAGPAAVCVAIVEWDEDSYTRFNVTPGSMDLSQPSRFTSAYDACNALLAALQSGVQVDTTIECPAKTVNGDYSITLGRAPLMAQPSIFQRIMRAIIPH